MPWRPGAVELLADLRRDRRALRAGHDVLPAVRRRRSWPRCPPETFEVVVTGDAVERGKPLPGPLPQGRRGCSASTPPTAWPSRTPTRAPAAPRRRAARCSACPTTSRSRTVSGGCSSARWKASRPGTSPSWADLRWSRRRVSAVTRPRNRRAVRSPGLVTVAAQPPRPAMGRRVSRRVAPSVAGAPERADAPRPPRFISPGLVPRPAERGEIVAGSRPTRAHPPWTRGLHRCKFRAVPTPACGRGPEP